VRIDATLRAAMRRDSGFLTRLDDVVIVGIHLGHESQRLGVLHRSLLIPVRPQSD
jgi:hypothetical protein